MVLKYSNVKSTYLIHWAENEQFAYPSHFYLKTMTTVAMKGTVLKILCVHIIWVFACNISRSRVISAASKSYALYPNKVFKEFSEIVSLGSEMLGKKRFCYLK